MKVENNMFSIPPIIRLTIIASFHTQSVVHNMAEMQKRGVVKVVLEICSTSIKVVICVESRECPEQTSFKMLPTISIPTTKGPTHTTHTHTTHTKRTTPPPPSPHDHTLNMNTNTDTTPYHTHTHFRQNGDNVDYRHISHLTLRKVQAMEPAKHVKTHTSQLLRKY